MLGGPGGLTSFLRRRELGARLGAPSQQLDVGYSDDVPSGIRNAVKLRDQRPADWMAPHPAAAKRVPGWRAVRRAGLRGGFPDLQDHEGDEGDVDEVISKCHIASVGFGAPQVASPVGWSSGRRRLNPRV